MSNPETIFNVMLTFGFVLLPVSLFATANTHAKFMA